MIKEIKDIFISEYDLLFSELRYTKKQMDNLQRQSLRKED